MGLTRASLTPIRPEQPPIVFQFNPTQYTLDAANQLAELGVPGLRAPVLQYVRGASRTIGLELLFDAYDAGGVLDRLLGEPQEDVTEQTESIYALLAPTPDTGAPPICMFAWQDRRLQCVVERVSGRFTMFRADGSPVRATLAVTLREYVDSAVVLRASGGGGGAAGTHTVQAGDTLPSIAMKEYSDKRLWRRIASANAVSNPLRLQPGTVLVIPPKDPT